MPGCNRTRAGYYPNGGAKQRITLWIRTQLTSKGSNGNSSGTFFCVLPILQLYLLLAFRCVSIGNLPFYCAVVK